MTSKITTTVNPLYYLTYIFASWAKVTEVTMKSVEKKIHVNQHNEIDGRNTCVA